MTEQQTAQQAANVSGKDSDLLAEHITLQSEVERLRTEKGQLLECLGIALFGKAEIDKQAILAGFGNQPSINELIAELENSGD